MSGRVDGSGQCLMPALGGGDRQFQIVADLCQNSNQGLSHLGDQISFMY